MLVAAGVLGAILGSFINALSFRYNTGRSALRGRSQCMRCAHTLHALDLIPVFSYLWLRGRCRYCQTRISWQYPLVEVAAAGLTVLVYTLHPEPVTFVLHTALWMTLLFIVVYDLRHSIIPWSSLSVAIILSLLVQLTSPHLSLPDFWAGPLLAAPLFLLSLFSQGRWMGWGDGPLQLCLGWLLGLTAGASALALAFWSGALVGIALVACSKAYTIRSEIPFAPFLVLGAGCAYFLHVDFFQALLAPFF